mmetsp:Transcript_20057/g.48688  ORF Transcript_20057/g.48688 Transcript_20057/m.48688 type:complete len:218 (-) Transcript_20057:180-833(-)
MATSTGRPEPSERAGAVCLQANRGCPLTTGAAIVALEGGSPRQPPGARGRRGTPRLVFSENVKDFFNKHYQMTEPPSESVLLGGSLEELTRPTTKTVKRKHVGAEQGGREGCGVGPLLSVWVAAIVYRISGAVGHSCEPQHSLGSAAVAYQEQDEEQADVQSILAPKAKQKKTAKKKPKAAAPRGWARAKARSRGRGGGGGIVGGIDSGSTAGGVLW